MKNFDKPDVFVYGMTGSGKDTISDYIKAYYEYRKMRIAGTIKQAICEKHDLTHEELEELKRQNPDFRMEHHTFSDLLGCPAASLNRTHQIASRRAYDFNIVLDPEKPVVISDVRSFDEATILLNNDFVGIFLARTTDEFKHAAHYTENNMFMNGQLGELSNNHNAEQMIVIFNGGSFDESAIDTIKETLHPDTKVYVMDENPTGEDLIEFFDNILEELQLVK